MRKAIRSAAVIASVPLAAVLTSPAFASNRDDGDNPGPGLTVPETLLWFVVVPGAVIALIWLAVLGASWARAPRYRPGLSWWADPVWLNGPDGGASALAPADPAAPGPTAISAAADLTGGGARARW